MISNKMAIRIGWSLPLATVLLTSIIHIISGNYRAFPFFISEADYPGLERVVFKFGFFITGLILIYVSYVLFNSCRGRARWYWIHISGILGAIVGVNLSLMAIWDIYDHERLHVITASSVFQFGLAWGVVTHLALPNASKFNKKMRYFSISFAFLAYLGMIYSINLGLQEYPEFVEGKWDFNKLQPWINWAAPLEYLMVFSFMMTLASFEDEIQKGVGD